jgi:mannose-1-phosphate guanylyltransferase/mannose-1-phosphate guanylyltransferase/mannose-6-phosphate isomerase
MNMSLNKPFTIEKPWGYFRQFTHNEQTTVKILSVNAGEKLSLQTHAKRKEFWRVIVGNPTLTIGEETIDTQPGDEFTIEIGQKHRIATTDTDVIILEIASGYFDEDDIVRFEDKYNRD